MDNTIQILPRGRTAKALIATPFQADMVEACIAIPVIANILYVSYCSLKNKQIELLCKEMNIKIFMCAWGMLAACFTTMAIGSTLFPKTFTELVYYAYSTPTKGDDESTMTEEVRKMPGLICIEYCFGLPKNWDPTSLDKPAPIQALPLAPTAKSLLSQPFAVKTIMLYIGSLVFANVATAVYRTFAGKDIKILSAKTNSQMMLLLLGYQVLRSSLETLELVYNPQGKTQHIYGFYSVKQKKMQSTQLKTEALNLFNPANPNTSFDEETKQYQTQLQAMETRYNLPKDWNPYSSSNDSLA